MSINSLNNAFIPINLLSNVYIRKLNERFNLYLQKDAERFCALINEGRIHPGEIFNNDFIKTDQILKLYSLFADKITTLDLRAIANMPQRRIYRFPQGCKKESSLLIYQLLARVPIMGHLFSENSEISEIVKALPDLGTLHISLCEDPPSSYAQLAKLKHLAKLSLLGGHIHALRYVGQLKHLEVLEVSYLNVPESLTRLANLKQLRIEYSLLEEGFQFANIPSLEKLCLIGCQAFAGKIPSVERMPNLTEFALVRDRKDFCENILAVNLKKIQIEPHDFNQKMIMQIGKFLPRLEEIVFAGKSYLAYDFDFTPPLNHLTKLSLIRGDYTIQGIPAVKDLCLENCDRMTNLGKIAAPALETLAISSCPNFTGVGMGFPKLKRLKLDQTHESIDWDLIHSIGLDKEPPVELN